MGAVKHNGREPSRAWKCPETLGRGSLSLNQVLKDRWNLTKYRKKRKVFQGNGHDLLQHRSVRGSRKNACYSVWVKEEETGSRSWMMRE